MPTPQELMQLGQALVEHCSNQNEQALQDNYYAQDAVSVEAVAMPDGNAEAVGLAAIKAKNEWWYGAHELHSSKVEGPFVHGDDRFSVIFDIDVTQKESGQRMQMREIATYHVNQEGKITREEFAYPVEG
ncbi:MAG: nuclear transport factor 2 family protein [Hyphomonas sp.]|jgi:SnoaL-like protein|nr:nuclear transport factor 2 family protein [Henriciella sp.]MBO6695080.1 nuclear transport factor 2 family protein [Henriciella sp.]MCR9222630.1 nuclear transport factor 2 family protein [Hyphomonas sp.]